MSPHDRLKEAKRLNICFNCLKSDHLASKCKAGTCKKCSHKHNTLLHIENASDANDTAITVSNCSNAQKSNSQILLATAIVEVVNQHGQTLNCRALLDSASQTNFITHTACKKLGLTLDATNQSVMGISGSVSKVLHKTKATIRSKVYSYSKALTFNVVPKITENLPLVTLQKQTGQYPNTYS